VLERLTASIVGATLQLRVSVQRIEPLDKWLSGTSDSALTSATDCVRCWNTLKIRMLSTMIRRVAPLEVREPGPLSHPFGMMVPQIWWRVPLRHACRGSALAIRSLNWCSVVNSMLAACVTEWDTRFRATGGGRSMLRSSGSVWRYLSMDVSGMGARRMQLGR